MDTPTSQTGPISDGQPLPAVGLSTAAKASPPPGNGLIIAWSIAVALALLLLLAAGTALLVIGWSKWPKHARTATPVPSQPPPTMTRQFAPPVRPMPAIAPTTVATTRDVTPPPPPEPTTLSLRPGDTDLSVDPLAAYAGGPRADRLTVHGLRVGLPVSDIPPAMLAERAPDHLRDAAGDLCAVDDGRISEIHVRDPAILIRMPMSDRDTMWAHFGKTDDAYDGGEGRSVFRYPARGLHVCWDFYADRLVEVVLCQPGAGATPPHPDVAAAADAPPSTARRPGVPARPGDTDLWTDPLAVYVGGPSAARLTVHGIGIDTPVADIPPALLADAAPAHLRDTGGNLFAVKQGRVSEVHVRDPALLARWPLDSTNYIFSRFGDPEKTDHDGGDHGTDTFLYPDRGIRVRWDDAAGRITEVVLFQPGLRP